MQVQEYLVNEDPKLNLSKVQGQAAPYDTVTLK